MSEPAVVDLLPASVGSLGRMPFARSDGYLHHLKRPHWDFTNGNEQMTDSALPEVHERIQSLVSESPVLLFMKGNRAQPQCGFSSQVVQTLNRVLKDYSTVDVLADPEIRDGIKEFSDWPTIPQLYVAGEFQGGCDIVVEMYFNGELHKVLGLEAPAIDVVELNISDAAVALLGGAKEQYGGGEVHLGIDASYEHSLAFGPISKDSVQIEANGMTFLMDPDSAGRANGLVIDVEEGPQGPGLKIDNPNAPAGPDTDARQGETPGVVMQMTVDDLHALRQSGSSHVLIDVRTEKERATAKIEGALWLEPNLAEVNGFEKDRLLVFHCHSGKRSQMAAENFASLGFSNVHNLAGGIDAWSVGIDQAVPRY